MLITTIVATNSPTGRAGPVSFSITFPSPGMTNIENASVLATSLSEALQDPTLDLGLNQTTFLDAKEEYASTAGFFQTWSATRQFGGSPPASHLNLLYRSNSLIAAIYSLKGSAITAPSASEMGSATRSVASRLGVPLDGSEVESRQSSGHVSDGSVVWETHVTLSRSVQGWPLGYANRFSATFDNSSLRLVTVATTSWITFSVPPMTDIATAISAAASYANLTYRTELEGYKLSELEMNYIAWSWDSSRMVYVVWLAYAGPDWHTRTVSVAVDVEDTTVVSSSTALMVGGGANPLTQPVILLGLAGAVIAGLVAIVLVARRRREVSSRNPPRDAR